MATSYTVTGPTNGHQLVPITWTITMIGGDFTGTVTTTPSGGVEQCLIFYPIITEFNGVTTASLVFTPQDVDSVTFTFTNSGGLVDPEPMSFISTAEYLVDTFSESLGTFIQSHISNTLSNGASGSGYTVTGSGTIELDGSGMVFLSSIGDTYAISQAIMPLWSSTTQFEVLFDIEDMGGVSGSAGGIVIVTDSGDIWNIIFNPGAYIQLYNNYTTQAIYTTTIPPSGTLWHMKFHWISNGNYPNTYLWYSTDNVTWNLLWSSGPYLPSLTSQVVAIGPYMQGTAVTATTGVHIGNIIVQDLPLPSPNTIISNAYVASSGESIVLFFETNGVSQTPITMYVAPTVYKNGVNVGDMVYVLPLVNPNMASLVLPLPYGVIISTNDTVTLDTLPRWLFVSNGGILEGQSGLVLINYVGKSAFGTDTLQKTLRPGFNLPTPGTAANDYSQVFKNMVSRLNMNNSRYLPTILSESGYIFDLIDIGGQGSEVPSFFDGVDSIGYFAIGYDDTYISNGGTATGQLKIVPNWGSSAVVTQITSCDNSGINGIGQFYLFEVICSGFRPSYVDFPGMPTFNTSISLQYPSGSGNTWIENLWILGPEEFTFTLGTPLSFDRSNPWQLSNSFLSTIPYGVGSIRFLEALIGAGSNGVSMVCEPWEGRQITDQSWNGYTIYNQITFVQLRPFVTSTSPYIYADQYGSPWTAISSPLSISIDTSQTTITLSSAAIECNGNPIFYGIMIAIGGQGGPGTLEYMRCTGSSGTSVTVARGSAFNGVLTPAVAHNTGEIITLGNQYAWTSLAELPNWWSGYGHQTVEVVCNAPHNLKSGIMISYQSSSTYPCLDTNGVSLNLGGWSIILVTGATTFVVSNWLGSSVPVATLESTYDILSPVVNFTNVLPVQYSGALPYEAACYIANTCNSNMHMNFPVLASDSYVYQRATQILNATTPGKEIYIELGNEPFNNNWITAVYGQYLSPIIGPSGSDQFYWYILRENQIVQMVKTVFATAGRQNEIKLFLNCGPGLNEQIPIAKELNVNVDAFGLAVYYSMDNSNSSTTFCNNSTINQIADLLIHQIYYLPGSVAWNNGIPGNEFSGPLSAINSYNIATGNNCVLYSYEGGYSTGCSTNSYGPMGSNYFYSNMVSSDVRYMPVWRIYEKDFYAMIQENGYSVMHTYAYSLYTYYQNKWMIYAWPNQKPGKGDGSDGLTDNRLFLNTPGYTGSVYKTAGYIGPGSGTVSVTNGSTSITFSESQSLAPGNWISVTDDPTTTRYYISSGSETTYTVATGISTPVSYGGPTNLSANWSYGTAVDQDQQCVSVRGQALIEWMNFFLNNSSIWNNVTTGINSASADKPVELGVQFSSNISGVIIGIQFYKESKNTGIHVGNLWNSSGTLLATGTFINETASGWQQMNFVTPVSITAGTIYIASYHTTVGYYADNKNYFTSALVSSNFTVPINGGVYHYNNKSLFPKNVSNASNYWVDILFQE